MNSQDTCRTLENLPESKRRDYAARWGRVLKEVERLPVPRKVADYDQPLLDQIAEIVGKEFFGEGFIANIRLWYHWHLQLVRDAQPGSRPAAGATGFATMRKGRGRRLVTTVFAAVVDQWLPEKDRYGVLNDGWPCRSRLEWFIHIVGHELVHVAHLNICGHPAVERGYPMGHTSKFQRLNRIILGGVGFKWKVNR